MAYEHDDPPEMIGVSAGTLADPKGAKPVAPVVATALADEMAAPVPGVAIYTPPAAGEAHPKIARKSVAERLDLAEANLNTSQLELNASYNSLRSCEREEAVAHSAFITAMPGPTHGEVLKEMLAKDQAAKLARVQAGLSPTEQRKPTHGNSAVDIAASQRPRASAQQPTAPLRSAVARRIV